MLRVHRDRLAGPAPSFPPALEERITLYLQDASRAVPAAAIVIHESPGRAVSYANTGRNIVGTGLLTPAESLWILQHSAQAEIVR